MDSDRVLLENFSLWALHKNRPVRPAGLLLAEEDDGGVAGLVVDRVSLCGPVVPEAAFPFAVVDAAAAAAASSAVLSRCGRCIMGALEPRPSTRFTITPSLKILTLAYVAASLPRIWNQKFFIYIILRFIFFKWFVNLFIFKHGPRIYLLENSI